MGLDQYGFSVAPGQLKVIGSPCDNCERAIEASEWGEDWLHRCRANPESCIDGILCLDYQDYCSCTRCHPHNLLEEHDWENVTKFEFAQWRKHNRLEGWMEALYERRGGREQFNCLPLELTKDDLTELEKDVDARVLPETGGFFYGYDSYGYDSSGEYNEIAIQEYGDYKADKEFINEAKLEIDQGRRVFYECWW